MSHTVLSKVRNGFSRIRNLANLALPDLLPTITLMLSTGGRGKYANIHPVNPHRTYLPHVQSEILRVFHLCDEEIILLMIFVSENLETRE